jgi:hypothetical protein
MKRLHHTLTMLFLGIILVGCADAPAPTFEGDLLQYAMELDRSGEWEKAAQAAQQFLDTHSTASLDETCEAYYYLAYAKTRLGDSETARATLSLFDQQCSRLPAELWIRSETDKLRVELGLVEATFEAHDDGFWQTADGTSLGLDPHALAQHQSLCERTGADACLVVYKGKIVQEWYSPRYHVPMYAMSSTKSVTGLLVGMLIADGKIASIDEPVCTYIPEWCEGEKGRVTLRHLLSMTSGLAGMRDDGVGSVADKNPFVIALPLSYEPGTRWDYSNEGVQLLSPILDEAAGEPIQDYARKRLFEPVGMMDTRLHLDEAGHAWTYADMETTLRDFARLGLLMLNRGTWQGQQIVGESWVAQSTTASQELFPDHGIYSGYGLLWWLLDDPQGFAAQGHLDTDLYVFPELDLVIARMQSAPSDIPEGSYDFEALPLIRQLVQD